MQGAELCGVAFFGETYILLCVRPSYIRQECLQLLLNADIVAVNQDEGGHAPLLIRQETKAVSSGFRPGALRGAESRVTAAPDAPLTYPTDPTAKLSSSLFDTQPIQQIQLESRVAEPAAHQPRAKPDPADPVDPADVLAQAFTRNRMSLSAVLLRSVTLPLWNRTLHSGSVTCVQVFARPLGAQPDLNLPGGEIALLLLNREHHAREISVSWKVLS